MSASIEGRPPALPPDGPAATMRNFVAAVPFDPDVFRAFLEMIYLLALSQEILSRPGFAARVNELATANPPLPSRAPSRADLLAMLS